MWRLRLGGLQLTSPYGRATPALDYVVVHCNGVDTSRLLAGSIQMAEASKARDKDVPMTCIMAWVGWSRDTAIVWYHVRPVVMTSDPFQDTVPGYASVDWGDVTNHTVVIMFTYVHLIFMCCITCHQRKGLAFHRYENSFLVVLFKYKCHI